MGKPGRYDQRNRHGMALRDALRWARRCGVPMRQGKGSEIVLTDVRGKVSGFNSHRRNASRTMVNLIAEWARRVNEGGDS